MQARTANVFWIKAFIWLWVALVSAGCVLHRNRSGEPSASTTPQAPVLQALMLTPRVGYFRGESAVASAENKGFNSNAGFVITNAGVVVIDTLGTPALGQAIIAAIAKITPQPVVRVILTHYHSDHFYGAQSFKAIGAEIWANQLGQRYLNSELAQQRLEQRQRDLAPWVDRNTHPTPADRWLDLPSGRPLHFELGGQHFSIIGGDGAHTADDLMVYAEDQGVLFAGDVFFTGRLPYVVGGHSDPWLRDLDHIEALSPRIVVPGHGDASSHVHQDLKLTRDYLRFLRQRMGKAALDMEDFDSAYAHTDWSAFAALPTFSEANRGNAYSVYLEMQDESLAP